MNKIILENEKIKTKELDNNIKFDIFTNETFGITTLTIEINENTNLELNYNCKEETKLETTILPKRKCKSKNIKI